MKRRMMILTGVLIAAMAAPSAVAWAGAPTYEQIVSLDSPGDREIGSTDGYTEQSTPHSTLMGRSEEGRMSKRAQSGAMCQGTGATLFMDSPADRRTEALIAEVHGWSSRLC